MTRPLSGAVFSPCPECGERDECSHGWSLREYRYELWRDKEPGLLGECSGEVLFCMLNGSTAGPRTNDPTVSRCEGFRDSLGFSRLSIGNLFGYRSTDPRRLSEARDPIGPENDESLLKLASRADMIICAWGAEPIAKERGRAVLDLLRHHNLHCLRLTNKGDPGHPLYLPRDLVPIPFRRAA